MLFKKKRNEKKQTERSEIRYHQKLANEKLVAKELASIFQKYFSEAIFDNKYNVNWPYVYRLSKLFLKNIFTYKRLCKYLKINTYVISSEEIIEAPSLGKINSSDWYNLDKAEQINAIKNMDNPFKKDEFSVCMLRYMYSEIEKAYILAHKILTL